MLNICRTCNTKVYQDANVGRTIVIGDNAEGQCLSPSKALRKDRADAKRGKTWGREYYEESWQKEYLKQIKQDPEARTMLNCIFKMLKAEDVCLVFAEAEGWDTSTRKTIAGIFIGAGVDPSSVCVGHDFTPEEIEELSAAYPKYQSI